MRAILAHADVYTARDHEDPRLRGRTYAIPFEDVWHAAMLLVSGGQRGWRLVSADDDTGLLRAQARRSFPEAVDDVAILITLDANAQTRVDAAAGSYEGLRAVRRNTKRLERFFRSLDQDVMRAVERRRRSGLLS
jgi:hypothetical protein